MSALLVRWVLVVALAAFALGAYLGYRWNAGDTAKLQAQVTLLTGERDVARSIANGNADNLTALRGMFKAQRDRHVAMQAANDAELAVRAQRIAELSLAAERRERLIRQKASTDEECAVLGSMPVCAAVADRLWPATAGTH